jgi:Secretion system C-terminal sorting domain
LYIDNINIQSPLAIANITEDNSLAVYPNPSNGNFNIKFDAQAGTTYNLSIYNVLGQEVIHTSFQSISGQFEYPVNLSSFGSGIYTVVLKTENQQTVKKVAVF